jgi:hypothetical protein
MKAGILLGEKRGKSLWDLHDEVCRNSDKRESKEEREREG